MRQLTTKEAVDNLLRVLLNSGKQITSKAWQGVELNKPEFIVANYMTEVCNLFVTMDMEFEMAKLQWATGANLPWAEDHFQERLAGSSNPGSTYLYWPYANDYTNYLKDGKFSHTYQERFWPSSHGSGNWNSVVNRLCDDTSTRQAFFSIWHPQDQANNNVRVPCTIGYWFKVSGGVLDITYLIRSCDARRHLRNDIYMTQRLAHEMVQRLRVRGKTIELGKMSMWIGSLHCFQPDLYEIKKQVR